VKMRKHPIVSAWFALPAEMRQLFRDTAREYKLPLNLLAAVSYTESAFNPKAKSHCGAMGLMQLMPATAKELGVMQPWDAAMNLRGGAKYLKRMLDIFENVDLALAAYNAGPGNVRKYGDRIPPFPETQRYVVKVKAAKAALDK